MAFVSLGVLGFDPRRYEKCHSVVWEARWAIYSECRYRPPTDIRSIRLPGANWRARQLLPKWKWFKQRDDVGHLKRLSSIPLMQLYLAERGLIILLTSTK
jgi:hypothetical protein